MAKIDEHYKPTDPKKKLNEPTPNTRNMKKTVHKDTSK